MKTPIRTLLTTLAAATLLFSAGTASADRGRGGDRDDWARQEWRDHDHRHDWRHAKRHWKHHRHHDHWDDYRAPVVVRERVVIREQPIYRDYRPRPSYGYADPAVVIGVSIPPLVIPLR